MSHYKNTTTTTTTTTKRRRRNPLVARRVRGVHFCLFYCLLTALSCPLIKFPLLQVCAFRQSMSKKTNKESSSNSSGNNEQHSSGGSPDLGPFSILLYPGKKFNYSWQASLESNNGRAHSKEISHSTWSYHRSKKIHSKQSIQRVTHKLVSIYPIWLAKPKVTLGFLKTKYNPQTQEITIHPRFFSHLDLLTFGQVRIMSKNKNKYKLKLPITGGLLAMTATEMKTTSAARRTTANKNNDCGCLIFKTHCLENHQTTKKDIEESITCELQTSISGNYCPWIAGPSPVPSLRKWAYLSSQSLVHAYVMFQFHRTWNKRINTVC